MYAKPGEPTLDCQNCGTPVRILTDAEQQQVSRDPYKYVLFCRPCGEIEKRELAKQLSQETGLPWQLVLASL